MPSTNIRSKLLLEFREVAREKNPIVTADIEAVVVLSGESGDPNHKTNLTDTEERTKEGLRIFKEIKKIGGNPVLILTGTHAQNKLMLKLAKKEGIKKIKMLENIPLVPLASTFDQFRELKKIHFKKIAIVTHAYHGPRVLRYATEYLVKNCQFYLFLISRNKMINDLIDEEVEKIIKYSKKGYIPLFL